MKHQHAGHVSAAAGFTLIELMIVVVIVAVLALALVPMQMGHVKNARLSEGIAGVGTVRTALRTYASSHQGQYPTLNGAHGDQLVTLFIAPDALDGKFFTSADYSVTSTATSYTIRVTLPTDAACWYQVDQDGNESRGAF